MKASLAFYILCVFAFIVDIAIITYYFIKAYIKKCSLPNWLILFAEIMGVACWTFTITAFLLRSNGL